MKCLNPYSAGNSHFTYLSLRIAHLVWATTSTSVNIGCSKSIFMVPYLSLLAQKTRFLWCWFTWQPCHHIQHKPVTWVKFTSCCALVGLPLVLSLLINKLQINYITKTKYKLRNINIHSASHAHSLSWTALIWWSFQLMQSMACVLPKIPEVAFSENIGRAK